MERIQENDHRLVALQVPEGLKMQALEMMDEIETASSAKVVLAADPCYGACDLVHDKIADDGRGISRPHGPLSDEYRIRYANSIY